MFATINDEVIGVHTPYNKEFVDYIRKEEDKNRSEERLGWK